VVQGYLRADPDRYGALVLTESSRPLLRGEQSVRLRLDAPVPRVGGAKKAAKGQPEVAPADGPLWDALRECRQRLASRHNVPPYVIFHDSTLRQMLAERPADQDELLAISGVGQSKLTRYGDEFLAVLREH
jgi:ATP-dependent DNA helicase RecQ